MPQIKGSQKVICPVSKLITVHGFSDISFNLVLQKGCDLDTP